MGEIPSDNHRNKKKLHGLGGAAAKAKATLNALSPVPVESLEGMRDPRAVLCSRCEKDLNEIPKFERRLAVLKTSVEEKVNRLMVPAGVASLPGSSAAGFQNVIAADAPDTADSTLQGKGMDMGSLTLSPHLHFSDSCIYAPGTDDTSQGEDMDVEPVTHNMQEQSPQVEVR